MLYGERSAVWDQAENRLHAQKALLELLISLSRDPSGVRRSPRTGSPSATIRAHPTLEARMKKLLATVCVCLALGLVAAGCGGDDDGDSGAAAPRPPSTRRTTAKTEASGGGAAAQASPVR